MLSANIIPILTLLFISPVSIGDATQITNNIPDAFAFLTENTTFIPVSHSNDTYANNNTCVRVGNETCQKETKHSLNDRSYLSFYFITMALTVFGYALVIPVIAKKRQPSSVFIISLAISDFFIVVIVCPIKISEVYGATWQKHLDLCRLANCITMWGIGMAALNMVVVSFDRLLFFAIPLKYPSTVTVKRAIVGCCIAYLFTLPALFPTIGVGDKIVLNHKFCAFKFTLSRGYLWFVGIMFFFVPSGIIACFQIAIVCLTKRYYQRNRNFIKDNPKEEARNKQMELSFKREMRIQRMFLAIVIMFVVCWGPFIAGIMCNLMATHLITPTFIQIMRIMLFVNSFINPFIMIFTNPKSLRKQLLCLKNKKRNMIPKSQLSATTQLSVSLSTLGENNSSYEPESGNKSIVN